MFSNKLDSNAIVAKSDAAKKDAPKKGYQRPELLPVGKAIDLVQGGGGGNYSDANRTRYY